MPGPVPSLGERVRNAVTRGESLEKHLAVKGEKVYETEEQAVEKMLQVNMIYSFFDNILIIILVLKCVFCE